MSSRLNFQYLISYLGLTPYFLIIINKFFLFELNKEITNNFLIYYTLIIIVFIGAINWNLTKKIKPSRAIYGSFPSLFALIIIVLNLFKFNFYFLVTSLSIFLFFQLIFDYLLNYSEKNNKKSFFQLRLPLTIIIIVSIFTVAL